MKKPIYLLLIAFSLCSLMSCDKADDPKPIAEIDKLPPATQTGANKVGCLLDGKAFLPGNFPNATNCFYQFVNGEYYFALNTSKVNQNNLLISLGLVTNAKKIEQNGLYVLKNNMQFNAYGQYGLEGIFTTTNGASYTGELKITKLDPTNFIVSGTFWFDILDFQGNLHQIREGRFDMQYTN